MNLFFIQLFVVLGFLFLPPCTWSYVQTILSLRSNGGIKKSLMNDLIGFLYQGYRNSCEKVVRLMGDTEVHGGNWVHAVLCCWYETQVYTVSACTLPCIQHFQLQPQCVFCRARQYMALVFCIHSGTACNVFL